MLRKIILVVLVGFFISSSPVQAASNEIEKLTKEVKITEKKLGETENKLKNIDKLKKDLAKDIKQTKQEIEELSKEKKAKEETFGARMRATYMRSDMGFLKVLLSSEGPLDFLVRRSMVEHILEHDRNIIEDMNKITEELEEKQDFLKEKEELAQDTEKTLKDERDKYKNRLEQKRKKLKTAQSKLASTTAVAHIDYNGSVSGRFVFPTRGSISSRFGSRASPGGIGSTFHKGIDIACSVGTPVVAAEDGVVIKTSGSGGYGHHLIINHGQGLTTLYAHNSKLLVGVGTKVKKGQRIALSGNTGTSTGPHLHFEVRRYGACVNPMTVLN